MTCLKLVSNKYFYTPRLILTVTHVDCQGTESYVLRMAEEDWDPDLDIPGLDSSAVITDVGVDQFVLCKQVGVVTILGSYGTYAVYKVRRSVRYVNNSSLS